EGHCRRGEEVAVDEEASDAPESDVDGEAWWVGMVLGDVVRAHPQAEERLVPIPERARHRRKARDRADGGDAPEDGPLPRAERRERLGGIERRQSGAKDTGLPANDARTPRKTSRRAPRASAAARWRESARRAATTTRRAGRGC